MERVQAGPSIRVDRTQNGRDAFWYKRLVNNKVREEVIDLRRSIRSLMVISATLLTLVSMSPTAAHAGGDCTPEIAGIRHCLS
jgi:hypothetical protein